MKGTDIGKFKKSVVYALVIVLVRPLAISGFGGGIRKVQAENATAKYFCNQLDDQSKAFYRAM